MISKISRDELQSELNRDPALVLLEALPEPYFRKGHLPGARWFPHDHVAERAAQTIPDKSARIVVYCASSTCQNSEIAARRLQELGYPNVRVYAGGKADWSESGLPLEVM